MDEGTQESDCQRTNSVCDSSVLHSCRREALWLFNFYSQSGLCCLCLHGCSLQKLPIKHIPGPEGVRGRNSDNTLILEKLGWQPTVSLKDGLRMTYFWIRGQIESEIKQRGADATTAYAHSTVVKTGAPTELGTLRKADGDEGFDKSVAA